MLTNAKMVAGRFERWAKARAKVAKVVAVLNAGGTVTIVTATRFTTYDKRHVAMFKAARNGAFVAHGRTWACFDFCELRFTVPRDKVAAFVAAGGFHA